MSSVEPVTALSDIDAGNRSQHVNQRSGLLVASASPLITPIELLRAADGLGSLSAVTTTSEGCGAESQLVRSPSALCGSRRAVCEFPTGGGWSELTTRRDLVGT